MILLFLIPSILYYERVTSGDGARELLMLSYLTVIPLKADESNSFKKTFLGNSLNKFELL
jgi:hypothetical protein